MPSAAARASRGTGEPGKLLRSGEAGPSRPPWVGRRAPVGSQSPPDTPGRRGCTPKQLTDRDPWSSWGGMGMEQPSSPRICPPAFGIGTGVTPALAGPSWSLFVQIPRIGTGVTLEGLSRSCFARIPEIGTRVTMALAGLSLSLLCPNPQDWFRGDTSCPCPCFALSLWGCPGAR